MTPAESIPITGLSMVKIAQLTGWSIRSVFMWVKGNPCPEPVRAWLEARAVACMDTPPPDKSTT